MSNAETTEDPPRAHPASFDVLGCPKCRWSLGGCAVCRKTPRVDRRGCPPLEERAGYAKYAKSAGLDAVVRAKRAPSARATGKKGAGKKAKANPAADFVDSSVEDYETIDGEASVENVDEGFGAPEREKTSAPVKRLSVPSTERPTTSEATAEEKTLTVEFDCGGYSADVIGKKGENQQVLQWKSGADVRAHPSKDSFIEIRGTLAKIVKAKVLVKESMEKAKQREKERASAPKIPPKRPSLDIMSIVQNVKTTAYKDPLENQRESQQITLNAHADATVKRFISKLPELKRTRPIIFEYTQDVLAVSKYEGVPEAVVSALRDRISQEETSASERLSMWYLLDSIAQASRVDARGGSEATHAMYVRALRRHLSDIVKCMIAVIKIDESTEMKDVEVLPGASVGEAHARHRRRAVQKVLSIWEARGVLGQNELAIGKKAISKFRHEFLKKQAKEFDKRLERQPEARIKVQADGVDADALDDMAAMLGNQYGGINTAELDLSALRQTTVMGTSSSQAHSSRDASPRPLSPCLDPMDISDQPPRAPHEAMMMDSGEFSD